MDVCLALDVSTSVIGWAVLPENAGVSSRPLLMDHIDLRKNKHGFWAKVDQMERELQIVIASVSSQHTIKRLYVEDPVERFRNGLSSAHTIALLAKFNALVSVHARRLTALDPLYIDATQARKKIGVPLLSKVKSGGVDQKQQTMDFLSKNVFKDEKWPTNRNGKIQPWCYDRVDAFVICLAGCLGLGHPA